MVMFYVLVLVGFLYRVFFRIDCLGFVISRLLFKLLVGKFGNMELKEIEVGFVLVFRKFEYLVVVFI